MERVEEERFRAQQAFESGFRGVPRVGPLEAIRRYWLLSVLPIIVLVPIVGILVGLKKPTYSAESRMIVGQLNLSSPGAIQGYAQAAQDLAATYPLVIDADSVVKPTATALHVTPAYVRAHLSATQVPSSSIVRIDGQGSSAAQAIAMTNIASKALVSYLARVNSNSRGLALLFNQVRRAELSYTKAKAKVPTSQSARLSSGGQREVAEAGSELVKVNAAVQNYQQNLQQQSLTALLQPVSYAAHATSNRTSTLEIALFGALVVGAILGIGAATLRANAVLRRSLTRPNWDPRFDAIFAADGPSAEETRRRDPTTPERQ